MTETSETVQRAMMIPEIIDYICSQIPHDKPGVTILARCCQLNNTWFQTAVRYLWKEITVHATSHRNYHNPLELAFRTIEPSRRDFYARYVETADLRIYDEDYACVKTDVDFSDVEFPKLKRVRLLLEGTMKALIVPRVGGNCCRELDVVLPGEEGDNFMFRTDPGEMEAVLKQTPDILPNLETVCIVGEAVTVLGSLDEFRQRLPRLKLFDCELVREVDDTAYWSEECNVCEFQLWD